MGNFQQLALNPWAAETGRAVRIVELMAGGNAGALLPAFLALLQRVDSVRRDFGPTPFFLCLAALLLLLDPLGGATLEGVWLATTAWISLRAIAGLARIWPGVGRAPLAG